MPLRSGSTYDPRSLASQGMRGASLATPLHPAQLRRTAATLLLVLIVAAAPVAADPWAAPGNLQLRHDIELLADAGIIRSPVTTWPLSWPDVARDALGATPEPKERALNDALLRVQRAARRAAAVGFSGLGVRISAARDPTQLRTFSDTPRAQGELGVEATWLGERFAANLNATAVASPADGQKLRLDGSYLGVTLANFMISVGSMERWWGPGWEGSLILGTNARPIPGLTIERNYTDPFQWRALHWLGPWRASIAVGQEERSGVPLPDVRFFAARLNFKPRPWFEFGLSRTAQFCGRGRTCTLRTVWDLLRGHDNQVSPSGGTADQPGNQMAGYDLRLRSPWRSVPLAFYAQMIGEDEAGGLPSKFLGLAGLETWMDTSAGSLRLRTEFADTACEFSRQRPQFNCAYRNSIFPQGYTYRGRIIGDSMDNDGRMVSLGVLLVRPSGETWSLLARKAELNRDGGIDPAHTVSATAGEVKNVELGYNRGLRFGELRVGLGYDDDRLRGSNWRGFLEWRQGL